MKTKEKRDVACWDLTTSQTSASTSEGSTQAGALVAPIRAPLRANSLSSCDAVSFSVCSACWECEWVCEGGCERVELWSEFGTFGLRFFFWSFFFIHGAYWKNGALVNCLVVVSLQPEWIVGERSNRLVQTHQTSSCISQFPCSSFPEFLPSLGSC